MTYTSVLSVAVVALVAVIAGCDTSVDPFQPSDRHFSIGGVIDASADTQFVRVSPLRRTVVVSPDPLDATVTTTDLATGETAVWHDSVFALHPEGITHNFWSAYDFEPGHRYRFEARAADGSASTAEVALPDTFPELVIQIPMFTPTATINVLAVEKLADLRIIFCGRELNSGTIQRFDFSLINRVSQFGGGYTARVEAFDLAQSLDITQVYWIRVLAMAAGPDWPDFAELDEETLALPDTYSNVENGVGYLGGVTSRLAPWPGFREPVEDECNELIRRW